MRCEGAARFYAVVVDSVKVGVLPRVPVRRAEPWRVCPWPTGLSARRLTAIELADLPTTVRALA
jgi:hypothetical protein